MIRYPYQKPFACKSVPNPFRDSILVALEIVRIPTACAGVMGQVTRLECLKAFGGGNSFCLWEFPNPVRKPQ